MRIKKSDKSGTIHELAIQLANIAEMDKINPTTTKDKNEYVKLLDKYKLFPSNYTSKQKRDIVSKLKIMNFNENNLSDQVETLKAINSYNRLINKKRKEIEEEILAGKNVKKNDLILKNVDKVELNIPRGIRSLIKIYDKSVKLKKISTKDTKNRINYYAGLNYNFLIKDGFSKNYYIGYEKLQKIRREGNVTEFILSNFEKSVKETEEADKLKFKSDPKRLKAKEKVYSKILKVINHNKQIATNKKYNKKLVTTDKKGNIQKDNSEYPVLMDITHEMIEVYIP